MTNQTFAQFEERLAEALPGYESRPQQQALAAAVESAIDSRRHFLGQAGCGTGKSLGYLIPAILSGKRVVVSTATKALQDQIAGKDLPFLAEHLDFTYALLKGRANYACPAKARDASPDDFPFTAAFLADIEKPDFTGERDEFSFEMTDAQWSKIAASTDDCSTYRCSKGEECFAQQARRRASMSMVVVVNHAMYVTDLMIRDLTGDTVSMLGPHEVVVFDESHEVEEYAASGLGSQFSEGTVRSMTAEVRNFVRRTWPDMVSDFEQRHAAIETALRTLWEVLPQPDKGGSVARIRKSHIKQAEDTWFEMYAALKDYSEAITALDLDVVDPANVAVATRTKQRLQRRSTTTASRFMDVIMRDFNDLVRWVEVERKTFRGKTEERKYIKTAPINVSEYLRPWLFANETSEQVTAILVSATMGGDNGKFVAERLGVDEFDWLDVGSPFDFTKQAVTYIPMHLPEPTAAKRTQWESMAFAEIDSLIKASEGRALVLFTSTKDMRAAYNLIADRLPYTCLMQGQKPNKVLAQEFVDDPSSVLFATRSFMTGVDFQGDTCSLVVISKLPFPVPSEPLTEARCEAIRAKGGNDFSDFVIPTMTLVLQQGYGRLIRHRNDVGCVAILDPRLKSKSYGTKILRALPDAPVVTKPEQVAEFYERVAT